MSIEVADVIKPEDRKAIEDGLAEHSRLNGVPPRVSRDISVVQRNKEGKIDGGLFGVTFWTHLYIDEFWVRPELQGRGIGRALLKAAEEEAVSRGCKLSYLWTGDWNAPEFYKKLGYDNFVEIPDFPAGHTRTGFMKRLAP